MSRAYYNENDPRAAAWLEELIRKGHIAPGDVDTRSIEDVLPIELDGYTQCHFFAGIGVWSHALRLAGWRDDEPVWSGSCPCQPFSQAGKGGGVADERHLWPAWFHLIERAKPRGVPVFGEQVASPAGLAWLDLVCADLEGADHSVRAFDLCAAGAGAPHIRQRLWWVADADGGDAGAERQQRGVQHGQLAQDGGVGRMADNNNTGRLEHAERDGDEISRREEGARRDHARGRGGPSGLGDSDGKREIPLGGIFSGPESEFDRAVEDGFLAHSSSKGLEVLGQQQARGQRTTTERGGEACELGNASSRGGRHTGALPRKEGSTQRRVRCEFDEPVIAGAWGDVEWLPCRDGKWRPVEPGTFPLAHGAPARVGRLRGYGNAIVAPLAAQFIQAYQEVRSA